jgi:4-hydroxy-2-oxoheptanedioate aldolase
MSYRFISLANKQIVKGMFSKKATCAMTLLVWLLVPLLAYGQNSKQLETVKRIKNNEAVFGSWIYLTDPAVTEIIANAGYDFVIFDLEHGRLDESISYNMSLALGDSKCIPIVRVAANQTDQIKKALETGALGIMVPFINNREEAEMAVKASKYPPEGNRGVDYGRGQKWGKDTQTYYNTANNMIAVILIVDTKEGVENIDSIVDVSGIDVILPGVYDLSGAYGVPGQTNHPLVLEAVEKIVKACKKREISIAAFATNREAIEKKMRQGARFIELTVDTDLIWQGAERLLKEAESANWRGGGGQ